MEQNKMSLPPALEELRGMEVWCNYRLEEKSNKPNHPWSKIPVGTRSRRQTGWRENLATYQEAAEAVGQLTMDHRAPIAGVGLLLEKTPYLAVDLDGMALEDGSIAPEAGRILGRLGSYVELSASRKGLHCIVKVSPELRKQLDGMRQIKRTFDDGTEMELLTTNYCAMTFDQKKEWGNGVRDCTGEVQRLIHEYMPEKFNELREAARQKKAQQETAPENSPEPQKPASSGWDPEERHECWKDWCRVHTDEQIIEAMFEATKLSAKPMEQLWEGGKSEQDAKLFFQLNAFIDWDDELKRRILEASPAYSSILERKKGHVDDYIKRTFENSTPDHPREGTMEKSFTSEWGKQKKSEKEPKKPENSKTETEKPKKEDKATGGIENAFNWRPWMEDNGLGDFDAYIGLNALGAGTPPWATGFPGLDEILDGGFYEEELVVLGAISSLGKTSFALQVASNMAEAGREVLFFSLEMSRRQLYGKLVSMYMFEASGAQIDGTNGKCATLRDVLRGRIMDTEERRRSYGAARDRLDRVAKKLHILEGCNNISVDDIKDTVEGFIAAGNPAPMVFLDYLQILRPSSRATVNGRPVTDKRLLVDYDVTTLKVLARDNKLPIMVISAFNRENYTEPVNMASFRESSGIEYTGDVIIAMQFRGMEYGMVTKSMGRGDKKTTVLVPETQTDHTRRVRQDFQENARLKREGWSLPIEVKVLKARSGAGDTFNCRFKPVYNFYDPHEIPTFSYEDLKELDPADDDPALKRDAWETHKTPEEAMKEDEEKAREAVEDMKQMDQEEDEAVRAFAMAPPVYPTRGRKKK